VVYSDRVEKLDGPIPVVPPQKPAVPSATTSDDVTRRAGWKTVHEIVDGGCQTGPRRQSGRKCRRKPQSLLPNTMSSIDWLDRGSPDSTSPAYRIQTGRPEGGARGGSPDGHTPPRDSQRLRFLLANL